MLDILKHAHSGLRWVVLILMLLAIVNSLISRNYEKKHKMINLFAMISLHTQLLIGLGLYFISPRVQFFDGWMKEAAYRFYGMEHLLGMIVAIVLVTIGRKIAEKQATDIDKHKKIRTFYTIALVIIIASIPWPFRTALGGAWF
ncbi:MAG: cytochrome b [Flavobacteriales bacterium]|nr:cytochrome b [Flavobacteriales bacterium]